MLFLAKNIITLIFFAKNAIKYQRSEKIIDEYTWISFIDCKKMWKIYTSSNVSNINVFDWLTGQNDFILSERGVVSKRHPPFLCLFVFWISNIINENKTRIGEVK